LQSTPFSLQLGNGSEKHPLGILEDVLIKVGDFCVLDDFIVVDMDGEVYIQIILGRPFLATFDCKIDVKVGWSTFDVGKCHVDFNFFEDRIVSTASFFSDEVPVFHEFEMDDVWCYNDPHMFDCVTAQAFPTPRYCPFWGGFPVKVVNPLRGGAPVKG